MKLRYWYKVDQNKQPIPGSNIRRKSRPGPKYQWKEILDPCCYPLDVSCTCGPRYFIQLDGRGKPVDGSLIKRTHGDKPEGTDGTTFYEIQWKSPCCGGITFDFGFEIGASATFTVSVNGVLKISTMTALTGQVPANPGDQIIINLIHGAGNMDNLLNVSGGHTFTTLSNPASYSFTWNGKDTVINAFTSLEPDFISWTYNLGSGYSGSIDILVNGVSNQGGPLIDPLSGSFGASPGDTIEFRLVRISGAVANNSIDVTGSIISSGAGPSPFSHSFVYPGGTVDVQTFIPAP